MRVRIHRGAQEIGGSCVEVEAQGKRIVLDIGRPLDSTFDQEPAMPDVPGLASGDDESLLGLLISHGHQDHWGLVDQVNKSVPIFMGEGAADVLRHALFFTPAGVDLDLAGRLVHRQRFELGPFSITPFLNDHSGFDTYALLIEAEGRRLFYSADFQGHGRKSAIFQQFLRLPPDNVNVLLMEGTNIQPGNHMAKETSESDVEEALVTHFKGSKGPVLITYSAQNIDRYVSVYRACVRSDKTFVIDLYTASIAIATNRDAIPKPGWKNLKVFVPGRQRSQVYRAAEFERLRAIKESRIYPEGIARGRHNMVLTFRLGMAKELENGGCLEGAKAIWSMWDGLLEQPSGLRHSKYLKEQTIPLEVIHASGHAYLTDLKKLAEAVGAERLVPMHSLAPDRFQEHFNNVELHYDGEWWDV